MNIYHTALKILQRNLVKSGTFGLKITLLYHIFLYIRVTTNTHTQKKGVPISQDTGRCTGVSSYRIDLCDKQASKQKKKIMKIKNMDPKE